jgi:hypothetical protein
MKTIDLDALKEVCGGMRWEDLRPSENVEDRRHLSPRDSMRVRSPIPPPLPQVPRFPGDLPSQAGIDDIKIPKRRRNNWW